MKETDQFELEEEKDKISVTDGFGIVGKTITGVGVGLLGASVGVAVLAASEVILPALLCLKAAGLIGGGVGLALGVNSAKKKK